nr:MAG TPA: hypothetical protein [Caudoviricetes sp.]DAW70126.1 MAG TPA: hypothetical protein [Caudoviricetes sp.]
MFNNILINGQAKYKSRSSVPFSTFHSAISFICHVSS